MAGPAVVVVCWSLSGLLASNGPRSFGTLVLVSTLFMLVVFITSPGGLPYYWVYALPALVVLGADRLAAVVAVVALAGLAVPMSTADELARHPGLHQLDDVRSLLCFVALFAAVVIALRAGARARHHAHAAESRLPAGHGREVVHRGAAQERVRAACVGATPPEGAARPGSGRGGRGRGEPGDEPGRERDRLAGQELGLQRGSLTARDPAISTALGQHRHRALLGLDGEQHRARRRQPDEGLALAAQPGLVEPDTSGANESRATRGARGANRSSWLWMDGFRP